MKLSKVESQLHGLYASGNKEHTSFPCGCRMQLVPDITRATTRQLPRVEAMIIQQQTFSSMITNVQTFWSGNNLDYRHTSLDLSLRDVLMASQTEGHPTILAARQFQTQILDDYMESDTQRTEEILNNLVPYMRYFVTHVLEIPESHPIRDPDKFNIIVDSYFGPLQIEAAEGYTWCPERDTVISSYDSYLHDISSTNDLFDIPKLSRS